MNRSITRSWLVRLGAAVATLALAACGGGGGAAGQSGFGTGGGAAAPAVADLVVALSSTTMANTAGSTVDLTVTAVDRNRNTVSNAPVLIRSDDRGAIITRAGTATGDDGRLQAELDIGSDRSNRLITVELISGAVTRRADVLVIGARLAGTLQPAVLGPGQPGSVVYQLVDQVGRPMANAEIQVNAVGLSPASASGRTDPLGVFQFNYTAGAAGVVQITAQAAGVADTQALLVQAVAAIPPSAPISTPPSLQVIPAVVPRNLPGSTSTSATISAQFRDVDGAPIPNVRVRFDLGGVPNPNGRISSGNSVLLSDANGVVTSSYIAGERMSAPDGVTVRACFAQDEATLGPPGSCPPGQSVSTTLTVTGEPVSVSIGTNELIGETADRMSHVKRLLVAVVNSVGVGQPGVEVWAVVTLPRFRKGFYTWSGTEWIRTEREVCPTEDLNGSGRLEIIGGVSEDRNGNGRLDPAQADVRLVGGNGPRLTRADGTVELEIAYAKNFSTWVDAVITVTARVAGTEGRASFAFNPVPTDAASIRNRDTPAYVRSPYGFEPGCAKPN